MFDMPVVRISIDHMRHQIIHAFGQYTGNLREQVQVHVDEAIARFDFAAEIEKIAGDVLRDEIRATLRAAVAGLSWEGEVKKVLVEKLREGLAKEQKDRI